MPDGDGLHPGPGAASDFQVLATPLAESHRVVVTGEIDLAAADRFEQEILGRLDGGRDRLILDLSRLSFMDVSGARALVRCHRRASEIGASFQLITGAGEPRRVLELCGWLEAFEELDEQSV